NDLRHWPFLVLSIPASDLLRKILCGRLLTFRFGHVYHYSYNNLPPPSFFGGTEIGAVIAPPTRSCCGVESYASEVVRTFWSTLAGTRSCQLHAGFAHRGKVGFHSRACPPGQR